MLVEVATSALPFSVNLIFLARSKSEYYQEPEELNRIFVGFIFKWIILFDCISAKPSESSKQIRSK